MRISTWRPIALLFVVAFIATSCSLSIPENAFSVESGGTETGETIPAGGSTTPTSLALGAPEPTTQPIGDGGGSGDGGSGDGDGSGVGDGTGVGGSGGQDPADTTVPGTAPAPVTDPEVGRRLASFGPWVARDLPPFTDDRDLQPDTFETADRVTVSCAVGPTPRTIAPAAFSDFAAFPFSGDKLPGLIVEGGLIEDGDLQVLPLPRASVPLVVNLASEAPSVVVDQPSPTSLQTAVSELMRAADARLSGLAVVPANVRFVQKEVSSYEEAVLSMGVSLRYDSPDLQAAFKSDFEQKRGVERHSVMVRLLQPMFTIRVDKSQIFGPGDYFSSDASLAQVDDLVGQSRLGPKNPPVLIDEVTYGRVVYVTVTSSKVTDSDELKVAISGAYNGFSGDATVENKNKKIVDESEIRVEAFGGNDDVALAALRSGEIQDFMESVDTSTAAPLSMVLRTLDGTKLEVTDQATINDSGCTRRAKPNEVALKIDTTGNASAVLWINGTEISTTGKDKSRTLTLDSWLREDSNNRIEIDYWPTFCVGGSMTVSFLVNGTAYKGRQWRMHGHAGEWVCRHTVSWNIDKKAGTVTDADGPPAFRQVAGS